MDIGAELMSLVQALDKAKVPYALCGGLALGVHGFPRATEDIDLLIRKRDVDKGKKAIRHLGYILEAGPMTFGAGTERETRLHRVSKAFGEDWLMLDFIQVEPGHGEAWKTRRRYATERGRITAVSPEGLILMKKKAGRPQDIADIVRLKDAMDGTDEG